MPLVRIDVMRGRTPAQLRALADGVHDALVDAFHVPERDRYQVIVEHDPEHLILQDTGLEIERSAGVVLLQITQQGRDRATKVAAYARLAEVLGERGLAGPEDLVVSVVGNGREDWSFGYGRAQFETGEL
jgi:phenylpyruvate tautomerase PptA (4-oxalocrotonate tautomerase family)